jgi:serine/threonine-protein kinase
VTAAGERLGTPGWMAPEQTAAEPGGVDARADVFGAGALLFFLLTRLEPVLPGDAERDPAAAHDDRVRTALRRLRPTPHRRLRAIIARALAYAPANRYPAVEALAADLDRFLDGASVEAHRENPWERTAAFVSRYRTPIALVLSYIVMRVLLILFAGP